jgi:hypothetical protein
MKEGCLIRTRSGVQGRRQGEEVIKIETEDERTKDVQEEMKEEEQKIIWRKRRKR